MWDLLDWIWTMPWINSAPSAAVGFTACASLCQVDEPKVFQLMGHKLQPKPWTRGKRGHEKQWRVYVEPGERRMWQWSPRSWERGKMGIFSGEEFSTLGSESFKWQRVGGHIRDCTEIQALLVFLRVQLSWIHGLFLPHLLNPWPYLSWTWISCALLCCWTLQGILMWKSASKVLQNLQKRSGIISLNLSSVIACGIRQQRGGWKCRRRDPLFFIIYFPWHRTVFFLQGSCSAELEQ